jgi:site-specific DNA-methyltransferase (adenine-specific)
MCGDATNKQDAEALMNGQKASVYLTDPPYGVSYSELRDTEPIENDDLSNAELQQFLEKAFHAISPHLKDDCAWYLWHAQKTQGYFTAAAAAASSVIYHRQIVWVKPSLIMGRGLYHWRHELCLMGWKEGHKPPFLGSRSQTTVWESPSPHGESIHPTQKPLLVLVPAIINHTEPSEVVVDNFGGSGSTLIACEQTGRICYMMEIDPRYCQVIVDRWEKYTGQKAVKTGENNVPANSNREDS